MSSVAENEPGPPRFDSSGVGSAESPRDNIEEGPQNARVRETDRVGGGSDRGGDESVRIVETFYPDGSRSVVTTRTDAATRNVTVEATKYPAPTTFAPADDGAVVPSPEPPERVAGGRGTASDAPSDAAPLPPAAFAGRTEWVCDVCRAAAFPEYDAAVAHEKACALGGRRCGGGEEETSAALVEAAARDVRVGVSAGGKARSEAVHPAVEVWRGGAGDPATHEEAADKSFGPFERGWWSRRKIVAAAVAVVAIAAIAGGVGAAVGTGGGGGEGSADSAGTEERAECLRDLGDDFRGLVRSRSASLRNWPEMKYELTSIDLCTNHGFFSPLCQSTELLRSRGLTYDEGNWRFEDDALLEYSHDDNGRVVAELTVRHSHDPLREGRLLHVRSVVDLESGCVVNFRRSEIVLPSLTGTRTFLDGGDPNATKEEERPAERHRCSERMSVARSDSAGTLVWYFESHPLSLIVLLGGTWILNIPTRAGHHAVEVRDAAMPEDPCVPSTPEHVCGPDKNGALGFAMLSGPLLELEPASNGLASTKAGAGDPSCSDRAWTSPLELREHIVAPEGVEDVTTPEQLACVQTCVDGALAKGTIGALSSAALDSCSAACLPDGPVVELVETDGTLRRQTRMTTRKKPAMPSSIEERERKFPLRRRLDRVPSLRDEENDPAPVCTKATAGIAFEDIHEWATVPPKTLENLFRPECSDLEFRDAVSNVVEFAGRIPNNETSTNRFGEVREAFEGGRMSLAVLIEGITDVEHLLGWTHNLLVQPLVLQCFIGPIRSDIWDLRVTSELLSLLPYVGPFFKQVANVLSKMEDIATVFLSDFLEALTVDQEVFDEFIISLATIEEVRSDLQHISYRVETVLEPALRDLSRIDGYSEVFDPVSVRIKALVEGLFYPLKPTLESLGKLGIAIVSELSSAFALDNLRATVCRLRDFFSQFRRFWEEFTSLIGLPLLQQILDTEISLRDVLFGGPVIRAANNMCGSDVVRKAFCAPVCRLIPGPLKDAAAEAKRVWNNAVGDLKDLREDAQECLEDIVGCGGDAFERIGDGLGGLFGRRRRLDEACEDACADICSCATGIGIGITAGGPVGAVGGAVEAGCLGGFVKRVMNEIKLTFTIRQVLEQVDRVKNVIEEAKKLSDEVIQELIEEAVMDLVSSLVPDFDVFVSQVPNLLDGEAFTEDKIGELLDGLLELPETLLCLVGDDPFSCALLDTLTEDLDLPLASQNTASSSSKPTAGPTPSPTSVPSSAPSILCVDERRRRLRATTDVVASSSWSSAVVFTDSNKWDRVRPAKRALDAPPNKYGLEPNPFCSYDFPYKLRITPMRRQKCGSDKVCWYSSSNSTGGSGPGGSGPGGSGSGSDGSDVTVPKGSIPGALDGAWVELDGNMITTTSLVFDTSGIPVSGTMTVMTFNQNGYALGTSRTLKQESSESVAAVAARAGAAKLVAFPTNTNQVVLFDAGTGVESVVSGNSDDLEDFGKAVALHADANSATLVTVSRQSMGDSQSHTFQLQEDGGGKWTSLQVSVDVLPDGVTSTILDTLPTGITGISGFPDFFYLARIRVDADLMGYVAPASAAPLPNPPTIDPTDIASTVSMGRVVFKKRLGGSWAHVEPINGDNGCSALSLGPNLVAAACGWYFSRRVYVMPKGQGGFLGEPEVIEPPGYVGKVTMRAEDLLTPDGVEKFNTMIFASLAEWALALALSPDERTLVLGYPFRVTNAKQVLDNPGVEIPLKLDSHLHVFRRREGASSWSHATRLEHSDFSLLAGVQPEDVYLGVDLAFADDSDTVFITGIVNDASYTQFICSFRISDLHI